MSQEPLTAKDRLILPLDFDDATQAEDAIRRLGPHVGVLKVGYQLGYSIGWDRAAGLVHDSGAKLFIDAKLDDISNTVGSGARALARLRPHMLTVHASAGESSVAAAKDALPDAIVIAITVLTHLSDDASKRIFGASVEEKVPELAAEAMRGGADAIVCAPTDLAALAKLSELASLLRVVPGVRPTWAGRDDQQRVATPADAIAGGASYLVVGRPITKPPATIGDSVAAAKAIVDEIASVVGREETT